MVYELGGMSMPAFGGQAEIYGIDGTKVPRVLKNPGDERLLKNEFDIVF